MAQAKTIKFGDQLIMISDMATPTPNFVAPCGFEQLTLTVNVQTNDTNVPDCDDPDLPSWLQTDVVSKQMRVTGSGVLDTDAMREIWQDWWLNDSPASEIPVRWYRDLSAGAGGGYFQAPAILTSYSETGQRGQRWQVAVELAFNGKPSWVPATT